MPTTSYIRNPILSFPRLILAIFFLTMVKSYLMASEEPPIDIKADFIEYDTVSRVAIARGKANISQLDQRITADEIEIHLDEEIIHIRGNGKIEKGGDVIYFSSATFIKEEQFSQKAIDSTPTWTIKGEMREVRGFFKSWVVSAGELDVSGEKYHARHKASFTTCSLPKPHYTITAARLKIVPKKFVSATHAIFWVGKVPIFYLPYWWKGIGDGKLNVMVEPGYNSIDGFYAKTVAIYDYSDFSRTKFLYDYYSIRGSGYGLESTHGIPDKIKASIYLYTINESNKEANITSNRWSAQSYLWWRLPGKWTAQSEMNFSSDESFNESYRGGSWEPVKREINSNLFFVKQTTYSYTSIGVSRRQTFDTETNEYVDQLRIFPSINYRRYKNKNYLGFYPEYSLGYTRQSVDATKPFLSDFSGSIKAMAQKKITPDINLSPYFGIDENYLESADGGFNFYGRYYLGTSARWRYASFSFLNMDYGYKRKFLVNSFTPDPEAVERNSLTSHIYFFPISGLTLKTLSGYDFKLDLIDTLSNELIYTHKGKSIFLNHKYNLNKSQYEGLLFVASYNEIFSFGTSHNNATPDMLGLYASGNFKIGPKNTFSIQYNANLDKGDIKPIARQIKYERDLHCWVAAILYRRRDPEKRPAIEEIFFNIGLKFDDITDTQKRELEREFYPWQK